MSFDFDTPVPRRGTGSYKWDTTKDENILPMWIADMDFPTAPCIIAALERRARHGIFGYTTIPDTYYDALTDWFATRHGLSFDRSAVLVTTGVVPAISAIIGALTEPSDQVIVQSPVYNCFYSSIRNMRCEAVSNRLLYRNGRYEMDFDGLERLAANPRAKLLLLCNPHNPVGRVWTRHELIRVAEICRRNGVTVISDEIHCEIAFPGHAYQPFASIGPDALQQSVTCLSPSKAFNLAGLQTANIIAADPVIRQKIDRMLNVHEVCEINPFGMESLIAAYTAGSPWLDTLNAYIYQNYLFLRQYIETQIPCLKVVEQEATYLTWIDCSQLAASDSFVKDLLTREKLWVSSGTLYGEGGEGFFRMNIACPRQTLIEGLTRLKRGVAAYL